MGDSPPPQKTDGGSDVQTPESSDASGFRESENDSTHTTAKPTVQPSALGKFVGLNQCSRFFKYGLEGIDEGQLNHPQEAYKEAFKRENVVEKKSGDDFEAAIVDAMRPHARAFHDLTEADEVTTARKLHDAIDFVGSLAPTASPVILFQPTFTGTIGSWDVHGDADLVFIWPTEDDEITTAGKAIVRVVDVKAATEEQAHQQIQTAVYSLLIEQALSNLTSRSQSSTNPDYTLQTGVLTREAGVSRPTRTEIPTFDRASREDDVRRLLRAGGRLDTLYEQTFEETSFQLERKCGSCPYNEACFSESIERAEIELLGISGGIKQQLAAAGIETLHDLAALAYPPDEHKPGNYEDMKPRNRATYEALSSKPGLGEQLPTLIQRAQSMVGALNSDAPHAHSARDAPWLTRSGYGSLPDDDPPPSYDLEYKRGSLVRVYLNLQVDHVHDRLVALGGKVTASASIADPITLSQVAESIPKTNTDTTGFDRPEHETPSAKDTARDSDETALTAIEGEVVDAFLDKLFGAVQHVANEIDFSGDDADRPPIHYYLFSDTELEALQDALDRRLERDRNEAGAKATHAIAFRDHIGGREGVDGGMVSIVQNDARKRTAPKSPSVGLLPLHSQFSPYDKSAFKSPTDWSYTPADSSRLRAGNSKIDLKDVFRYNLFDYRVPYRERDGEPGVELLMENRGAEPDGWYPSRVRFGAQIPLAYIWSAVGRIDDEWVEAVNSESERSWPVDTYRYHDSDSRTTLITTEDIGALIEHFTDALCHLERGLSYKNAGAEKHPIDPERLPSFRLPEPSLARTAREYLSLEYHTSREEALEHYGKQWTQRLRSGNSVLMAITEVEEKSNHVEITGRLPYDNLPFDNPERVLNAVRKKGSSGATGGSWMVATPIDKHGNQLIERPWEIERGVPVTIERLDIDNEHIEVTARRMGAYGSSEFQVIHDRWTTNESEAHDKVYFAEDQLFVLDPQADDINSERMADALEHASQNRVCQLLEGLRRGTTTAPRSEAFPPNAVREFSNWLSQEFSVPSYPNDEQQAFIEATDSEITLLQGPPGTGKTSGAVGPAIAARTYASSKQQTRCRSLVTGPSNKAVDEVMADVAEVIAAYRDDPATGDEFENVKLVRLTGSGSDDEDEDEEATEGKNPTRNTQMTLDGTASTTGSTSGSESEAPVETEQNDSGTIAGVDYVTYYDDDDEFEVREIQKRLLGQQTFASEGEAQEHLILFSTASRAWGLAGKLTGDYDADELLEGGTNLFDLLAIDEASMQTVPELLLAGSFYRPGGQVLIAGDHRQMPPVQQHAWKEERRPTVAAIAPYLSTLDYCRLLRGDKIDSLDEETRRLVHVAADEPDVSIQVPLYRLEETYRCHTLVADFLKRWVYANDNIDYRSSVTSTLHEPSSATEAIDTALEPEMPLTLIVHDDTASQQSNPTEAVIARQLVASTNSADETGIVTPHNAQRGLLERDFSANLGTVGDHVDVDTVERYQGGERDMMIVSGTAADPDYVAAESDFLLNRNRVNVAVSRMRRKLIVVASRSVFSHIPLDLDQYRESLLWKGLSQDLGVLDPEHGPDWEGKIDEFTGLNSVDLPPQVDPDTNIAIYGLSTTGIEEIS